jgi:two-component sensor histidine kinase
MLKLHRDRIDIAGCDVVLQPEVLQDVVLVVHELHTNAMKYGALSGGAGRVRIAGTLDTSRGGRRFNFVWQESGGRPVSVPTKQGYGHFLLHRVPEYSGGVVAADFGPDGLHYSCSWPLSRATTDLLR